MHPDSQPLRHRVWTKLAVALGIALPLLLVIVTLPWPFDRDEHRPGSTLSRMKQWGLVFKMYANDSDKGYWPPLARDGRLWTPDLAQLCPDYLSFENADCLIAQELPDRDAIRRILYALLDRPDPDFETAAGLMALSFAYLDVALQDLDDFRALVTARQACASNRAGNSLNVPGREAPLHKIREEFYSCFRVYQYGDSPQFPYSQSLVPTMVEVARWRNRDPQEQFPGAYVLYMDGHVEFVPLGNFPIIPEVMDTLSGLTSAKPPTQKEAATQVPPA